MPEAVERVTIHFLAFCCRGEDVRVEMRTRQPDDAVWRLAARCGISCPKCGKRMRLEREGKREHVALVPDLAPEVPAPGH